MKPFVLEYPLYRHSLLVCFGSTDAEVYAYFADRKYALTDAERKALLINGTGRTTILLGGNTVLRTKNVPRRGSGVLAHEIFHAVELLMERIGMTLTEASDEAYAYLIQWLTDELGRKLK